MAARPAGLNPPNQYSHALFRKQDQLVLLVDVPHLHLHIIVRNPNPLYVVHVEELIFIQPNDLQFCDRS